MRSLLRRASPRRGFRRARLSSRALGLDSLLQLRNARLCGALALPRHAFRRLLELRGLGVRGARSSAICGFQRARAPRGLLFCRAHAGAGRGELRGQRARALLDSGALGARLCELVLDLDQPLTLARQPLFDFAQVRGQRAQIRLELRALLFFRGCCSRDHRGGGRRRNDPGIGAR